MHIYLAIDHGLNHPYASFMKFGPQAMPSVSKFHEYLLRGIYNIFPKNYIALQTIVYVGTYECAHVVHNLLQLITIVTRSITSPKNHDFFSFFSTPTLLQDMFIVITIVACYLNMLSLVNENCTYILMSRVAHNRDYLAINFVTPCSLSQFCHSES